MKFEIVREALLKYTFIPKNKICKIAKISCSGYYAYCKRPKIQGDLELRNRMRELYFSHKGRIGIRLYKMELERKYNMQISLKKIHRIKNEEGLKTKIRCRSKHKANFERVAQVSVAENILNRHFRMTKPNTILTTDVTYLSTKGKTYYLSVMKDLASGKIVSHEVSERNDSELVMQTLNKLAIIPEMIHSDRGGVYTGFRYIQRMRELNIKRSMSYPGEPLDNAPIESFFGHLKDEVEYRECKNLEEMRDKIDKYIYYYNNDRPQWNKMRMTPNEYNLFLNAYDSV